MLKHSRISQEHAQHAHHTKTFLEHAPIFLKAEVKAKSGQGLEWAGEVLILPTSICQAPGGLTHYSSPAGLLGTSERHVGTPHSYSKVSIIIRSQRLREFMLLKHLSGKDTEGHVFYQQKPASISAPTSHRLGEG